MAITSSRILSNILMILVTYQILSVNCENIIDKIRNDPRLSETHVWASESGVLTDFDIGGYAFGISLSLPSNKAIRELRAKHPDWEQKIKNSKENMETLVLFAATDTRITPESIRRGDVADQDSIISLLAHYSSISRNGQLCINDFSRVDSCESYPKCCAQLDLDNAIFADDGIIYLIDSLVLPQEIIDKLR